MPAIGCAAVVKSVLAQCQTECGYRVYDCFAADRRQASSYMPSPGRRRGAFKAAPVACTPAQLRIAVVVVGAGLPGIGCAAVVKSVFAQCQTECGYRVYDCCAADRRQASSYMPSPGWRRRAFKAAPGSPDGIAAPPGSCCCCAWPPAPAARSWVPARPRTAAG